tara:strand:+ start:658 stop:1089 length:432 start_codon:yes stop_codon:yes gene_type:complete
MKIQEKTMIALGYGNYFISDSIIGLQPMEENRGPGQRTWVHIDGQNTPITASRAEGSILRDLVQEPKQITRNREQNSLLQDILESVGEVPSMLKSIIRDQCKWDLDQLEQQMTEVLEEESLFSRSVVSTEQVSLPNWPTKEAC